MISPKIYTSLLIKVIGILFIILFVYAAVSKILDFETFKTQIAQSTILSSFAAFIAYSVPTIEITIAIGLMVASWRLLFLYASFLLMIMFTTYILIVLNLGKFIPCSCGGIIEELSWEGHIYFNTSFIILAIIAIVLEVKSKLRSIFIFSLLGIFGVGAIAILYSFSENNMGRNNAFQRIYMPHPITLIAETPLQYNSYYLSGFDSDNIYIGNYKAPLYLTQFDTELKGKKEFQVSVSQTDLPYKRVRIKVLAGHLFIGDGTVPVLFKGNLDSHRATLFSQKAYFNHFTPADSLRVGLVIVSSTTKNTALALLQIDPDTLLINTETLTRQIDGMVDSDGYLLWNDKNRQFIYVYRYRNRYEVLDRNMAPVRNGKTIDTISRGIIDLAYYKTSQEFRLGGNTIVVNLNCATFHDYLFIESDRLGKYDDVNLTNTANIIDVYNFIKNTYEFSFYVYHEPGEELKDFLVKDDKLIALIGQKIRIEKLEPRYFTIGSN